MSNEKKETTKIKTRKKNYTSQFKLDRSLDALRGNGNISEIARRYALNANLLYIWRDQLIERGSQVFETTPDKVKNELKTKVKFFRFLLVPKHAIVKFAREQVDSGIFSITRICKLCGLSKNTYYSHKHPDERFVDKFEHIKTKVKKVIAKNSAYGVKRIKQALLDDYSLEIGRDTLGRLLRLAMEFGIKKKIAKVKKKRN